MFRVTRTKEKEGPAAHLAGLTGRLLLDGGSELDLIEGAAAGARAGRWSHARRCFFEARNVSPIRAGEALILNRELFMLERTIATADREARRQFRHERSRPVLDRLKAWLQERVLDVRPSSALGEAVRYQSSARRWRGPPGDGSAPALPVTGGTWHRPSSPTPDGGCPRPRPRSPGAGREGARPPRAPLTGR